jgi:hypothetical protein
VGQSDLYHNCEKRIKRPERSRRGARPRDSALQNDIRGQRRARGSNELVRIGCPPVRATIPASRVTRLSHVIRPRSDRKYKQRGYQDDDRERGPRPQTPRPAREPGAPAGARRISQDGPKAVNVPGYRELVRCAQCGAPVPSEIGLASQC